MTKEEALMTIQAIPESFWEKLSDAENKAVEMAVNALKGQMWIPCSERLPEEQGWYLAHVKHTLNGLVTIEKVLWKKSKYCSLKFYRKGNDCEVVAWMPLPEPYNSNIN